MMSLGGSLLREEMEKMCENGFGKGGSQFSSRKAQDGHENIQNRQRLCSRDAPTRRIPVFSASGMR
jgi:hypothetical protein